MSHNGLPGEPPEMLPLRSNWADRAAAGPDLHPTAIAWTFEIFNGYVLAPEDVPAVVVVADAGGTVVVVGLPESAL